jgi:urease accessory protein
MSALAAAPGHPGWQARLQLRFEAVEARSCLVQREHSGPLLVQRAFYPERPVPRDAASPAASLPCHVYVLHPPGGVVSGDELRLDVQVRRAAHALLTTPAAGKFYRCASDPVRRPCAQLTQTLSVQDGVLEWLPQENIYYPDSRVQLCTVVQLHGGARFLGWEMGCLGLPATGQSLEDGSVRSALELWYEGRPLLLERLHLQRDMLLPRWGLAGRSALGSLLAFPAGPQALQAARSLIQSLPAANCADMSLACTLLDGALICRGQAVRADRLKQAFIDLWSALRPLLLGRAPIAPRIWAT